MRVLAVDAQDHTHVIREMDLAEEAGSVSWDYTTETRVQATPSLADWSQWPENAWLRIVHELPDLGWSRVMFTGFVWEEGKGSELGGVIPAQPTLMSTIKALDVEVLASPHTVGAGVAMSDFFGRLMRDDGRKWRRGDTFRDYRMAEARTWGPDTSTLSCVDDLCDVSGSRLDVDPDGTLRLDGAISLSQRAPRCTIDANDPCGVVVEGSVTHGGDSRQTPSRYVVWSSETKDDVTNYGWGIADRPDNDPHGSVQRGYTVAKTDSLSDDDGVSDYWAEARRRLALEASETRTWSATTMFLPLSGGDIVDFAPIDEAPRRCVVQACDVDLGAMTCALTLKEV